MNIMYNVYDKLSQLRYFIPNEYLLKYSQIIEQHTRVPVRHGQTHKHHIIPKSWFKLNNVPVDNSLVNLVNLPCRAHFLAHYYLCLCTEDPFKYANQLALTCLESNKRIKLVEKHLLHNLPMYNILYEDFIAKRKLNYKLYTE